MVSGTSTKVPRTHKGERVVSSLSGAGKTSFPQMQKNEIGPLTHADQLTMD